DDRLWLWIDGDEVEFDSPTYTPFLGQLIQTPTSDDLTPVGIAAENLSATVSHLTVFRDVYYRAEFIDPATARLPEGNRDIVQEVVSFAVEAQLQDSADDPNVYADLYSRSVPWLHPDRGAQYRLKLDEREYLLLGDNSPRSLDGRLW